jgi:hypothetical protein
MDSSSAVFKSDGRIRPKMKKCAGDEEPVPRQDTPSSRETFNAEWEKASG